MTNSFNFCITTAMTAVTTSSDANSAISVPEGHHFYQLFRNWIVATHRYAEEWKYTDVHWQYRERPSVGFVAAAVWLSGGIALEEYWAIKRQQDSTTAKKPRTGRCDLYFRLEGEDFIAEAKHGTPRLSDAECNQQIGDLLQSACADAARLIGQERKLGIACVSLKLDRSRLSEREELIRQWEQQVRQSDLLQDAYWAYTFPPKALPIPKRDNWYPGCAVLIRECR